MIYDQLRHERLFDPDPPPDTGVLDLTRYDHLAVNTTKVHAEDDDHPLPPQDPAWIPATAVDEHGEPT